VGEKGFATFPAGRPARYKLPSKTKKDIERFPKDSMGGKKTPPFWEESPKKRKIRICSKKKKNGEKKAQIKARWKKKT